MKNAKQAFVFLLCSFSSFLFEYLLLFLLEFFFGTWMGEYAEKLIARALSSLLNFHLNFFLVFPKDEHYGKSLVKYYCLAIPVMFISAKLLELVAQWSRIDQLTAGYGRTKAAVLHTLLNAPVDILMMTINFLVQKFWVFARKKPGIPLPEKPEGDRAESE